jgi:hypothetical protein
MSGFSGHGCPETPDQSVLRTGNSNPETPGIRPDTPDTLSGHSELNPGHSGLDKEFHRKSPFKWWDCFLWFLWVLLSTTTMSTLED